MSAVWTIRSDVFDGPLDLLLHLVRREGVDLRTMRIAPITDAFLAYLDELRDLHLGVASDYLVMAATLCRLKALELLPRAPTATAVDAPEDDPREALVKRLVEHQRYKEAAEALDARPWLGRDVFARAPEPFEGPRPVATPLDAFGLLDLYHAMLRRASVAEPVHEVHQAGLDLGTTCRAVLRVLGGVGGKLDLGDVLRAFHSRAERVVAFLAVLEMARLRWVGLVQGEHLGPVHLESRVAVDADLSPVLGRIELAAG